MLGRTMTLYSTVADNDPTHGIPLAMGPEKTNALLLAVLSSLVLVAGRSVLWEHPPFHSLIWNKKHFSNQLNPKHAKESIKTLYLDDELITEEEDQILEDIFKLYSNLYRSDLEVAGRV